MTIWHRTSLAGLSSLLLVLGFAGFGCFPLIWVFLVPVLFAISGTTPRRAFWVGLLFGTVGSVGGYGWLAGTLDRFTPLPTVVCWILMVLGCVWLGTLFACLMGMARVAEATLGIAPVWVLAVVYPALELVFPNLFPYHIGASQYRFSLITQIVELIGMSGLTALIGLVNGAIYEGIRARWEGRKPVALRWMVPVGSFAAVLIFGMVRIPQVEALMEQSPRIEVALIQSNVGSAERIESPDGSTGKTLEMTHRALLDHPGIDWIIWPETAIHPPITHDLPNLGSLVVTGRTTLTGALVWGAQGRLHNSLLSVAPEGSVSGRYDKVRLIPVSEQLPFGPRFAWLRRLAGGRNSFEPGTRFENLKAGDVQVLPIICYEAIMPGLVREFWRKAGAADVLVNVSNDSWFGDTQEPRIHLALSTFRAIETRRAMVRCANTGISAIVDPVGRVVRQTEPWREEVLVAEVPVIHEGGSTPYLRWGNWFGWSCCAATLAGCFGLIGRPKRARP